MTTHPAPAVADDIAGLRAALASEQQARLEAEARASGAEAMVAHLKLLVAKLLHEQFGASSERGRKLLDQMEIQLEELQPAASEDATRAEPAGDHAAGGRIARREPVRGPLPTHPRRERVVLPALVACPCCGGKLAKLAEDITEALEVIPRRCKVNQTVREKFSCRACDAITQPLAPFHPTARGRAGPELLATIPEAKFGQHLLLNRQSETFARGAAISISSRWRTGWRLHGDTCPADSADPGPCHGSRAAAWRRHTVPVLTKGRTTTGRLWTYVRDDRPFAGPAPPAAVFFYSPDRNRPAPAAPGRLCRHTQGRWLCRGPAISPASGAIPNR